MPLSFPSSRFDQWKHARRPTMDLSTTPRRITEGVADLQKTRVAKSVFSIRSLVDVGDTDLSEVEDNEKIQSEFLPFHATVTIINLFFFFPLPLPLRNVPRKACWRAILHDRVRTLSFSYYTYEHTIRNMMLACKHETRWKEISNSNIPPPILDRNVCLALRCQNSRPSWSIPRGGHFSCQRSERDRETIDERRTF